MSEVNFFNHTLVLTSQSQIISLPVKKNIVINRLRIKNVRYNCASTGNNFMIINIGGWNENSIFYDGSNIIPYTLLVLLPGSINTPVLYNNPFNQSFDVIKNDKQSELTSFVINCLINNSVSVSNDITPSNPILIEIYLEGDKEKDIKPLRE